MKANWVFISHSTQDAEFVQSVVAMLQSPDMAPWIYSAQIIAGDDILDRLGHGLQSMDIFLFIVSRASLQSEWVKREVGFAVKKEINEKLVLVLPFIIDDTSTNDLPWFLSTRNATRVTPDNAGAQAVVTAVRTALERRSNPDEVRGAETVGFEGDPRIDRLINHVGVGNWNAAYTAAIEIIRATDRFGHNELFESLVNYLHSKDEDALWGAMMTLEGCAQLAPPLVSHELLSEMATHPDFSIRSSAASICMDFAQFTPDRVPIDILVRLSVHDEDWYVQSPATAALKTMARFQPAVLRIFFTRLHSPDPDAREYAARALAEIAELEPEILDAGELDHELSELKRIGDREAHSHIARAIPKVRRAEQHVRFKYGL